METKRGITITTLMIGVSILFILITATAISGSSTIKAAGEDGIASFVNRVADDVNLYYIKHKELPTTGDVIANTSIGQDKYNEIVENNDEANKLYVVNLTLLDDVTVTKGYGAANSKYVFLVAENTLNIYWIRNSN